MLEVINTARTQSAVSKSRRESRLTGLENSKFWADLSLTGAQRPIQLHSCLFQQIRRLIRWHEFV